MERQLVLEKEAAVRDALRRQAEDAAVDTEEASGGDAADALAKSRCLLARFSAAVGARPRPRQEAA